MCLVMKWKAFFFLDETQKNIINNCCLINKTKKKHIHIFTKVSTKMYKFSFLYLLPIICLKKPMSQDNAKLCSEKYLTWNSL